MRKYCKVYKLHDVRQFSGWTEYPPTETETALTDDDPCYLWDDYTVVRNPSQDTGVIFDNVTPEWQVFCTTILNFEIPEDLRDISEHL
jgi:hypothetical protein